MAFIGGGNYASRVLIPAFKRAGANLTSLVTSAGLNAVHHGRKHGFANASTDMEQAFDTKVMLKLWVKVKSGWSDDDRALRSLGFDER